MGLPACWLVVPCPAASNPKLMVPGSCCGACLCFLASRVSHTNASHPATPACCASLPQIVVAPPYETCTSLHGDEAAAMRVKKVVSAGQWGRLCRQVTQQVSCPCFAMVAICGL